MRHIHGYVFQEFSERVVEYNRDIGTVFGAPVNLNGMPDVSKFMKLKNSSIKSYVNCRKIVPIADWTNQLSFMEHICEPLANNILRFGFQHKIPKRFI